MKKKSFLNLAFNNTINNNKVYVILVYFLLLFLLFSSFLRSTKKKKCLGFRVLSVEKQLDFYIYSNNSSVISLSIFKQQVLW